MYFKNNVLKKSLLVRASSFNVYNELFKYKFNYEFATLIKTTSYIQYIS